MLAVEEGEDAKKKTEELKEEEDVKTEEVEEEEERKTLEVNENLSSVAESWKKNGRPCTVCKGVMEDKVSEDWKKNGDSCVV